LVLLVVVVSALENAAGKPASWKLEGLRAVINPEPLATARTEQRAQLEEGRTYWQQLPAVLHQWLSSLANPLAALRQLRACDGCAQPLPRLTRCQAISKTPAGASVIAHLIDVVAAIHAAYMDAADLPAALSRKRLCRQTKHRAQRYSCTVCVLPGDSCHCSGLWCQWWLLWASCVAHLCKTYHLFATGDKFAAGKGYALLRTVLNKRKPPCTNRPPLPEASHTQPHPAHNSHQPHHTSCQRTSNPLTTLFTTGPAHPNCGTAAPTTPYLPSPAQINAHPQAIPSAPAGANKGGPRGEATRTR